MAIATVDSRVQKFKDLYADSMNKDIAALNQTADANKQVITDTYGKSIEDTKSSYNEQQQLNEIQRYINERAVAENMANGGLQESGLNDTQRTAVQLSYANNKSKIQRAMDSAVENFRLEMNSKLTDIETNRISNESSIRQSYDSAALKAAQDEYETEYDNQTTMYKAALSAASKNTGTSETSNLYTRIGTTYDNNTGMTKIQFRDSKGKVVSVDEGINPYTGTDNSKSASVKKYGTFSNGYQPKGIVIGNYDSGKLKDTGDKDERFGKSQTVWEDKYGNRLIWNGYKNEYVFE